MPSPAHAVLRRGLFLVLALLGAQLAPTVAAGPGRPLGDSRLIAPVPFPGFPEGIAVYEDRFYVSGPAVFGEPANLVPSVVWGYDLETGALVQEIEIQGQSPALPRAISCIAFDDEGGLYVLDEEQGVLRIDVETEVQTTYAAPFFPFYVSPFGHPAPYLINDLAFDGQGKLYITDSFQAAIWRVPAGGGAPEVWFHDPSLDGVFGPNGVRVHPNGDRLFFVVSLDSVGLGVIYTLPLIDSPTLADLEVFHAYTITGPVPPIPDGIAFGRSDKLYVALAGSGEISVLDADGNEEARYSGPADTGDPANPLPWANPANIAFDNGSRSLLVTNHASLTGLPDPSPLFAVFDVFVDDKAGRLFKPDSDDDSDSDSDGDSDSDSDSDNASDSD